MGSGRIRVKLCIVANKSVMYDSWPVMSWPVMTRHGPSRPVVPVVPVTARQARHARRGPSQPVVARHKIQECCGNSYPEITASVVFMILCL